ncbi:threonylcarbamoyl-AMP synthase [Polyangium spumosum]|uniref:Threonylcarbamoyl-AMP synthase n=1 Tax=Polyangium spumosum TaxID=889282 RepID=A0A6N7PM53_9BACT|nr:threonylcarbamoyl-AMP synthase [Polyangium spumosum]
MLLPINPEHPEPRKIRRAVEILEKGGVIAYPTDTVYGLGCDLFNKQAIETLYQIKGMQRDKNLAFICPDLSDISRYAIVENAAYRVLKRFLPGPYCFVLQATREVPKIVQMNKKTVGIRVPSHPVTQAIVRELGRPIISTTAAPPGEDPMVDPWEIKERFPALELILDAGGGGSLPTTVVDLSAGDVKILREGAGPVDELV